MDFPSPNIVELLAFLLPGFIAASIYFALTPAPRPIPFERVVQALILTMVVQATLFVLREAMLWIGASSSSLGTWTSDVQLSWSVGLAVLLGLLLAWTTNRDKLHEVLRKWRLTDQTSFSSEWYGALSKNTGYIVLHLTGARRLYGWPQEWPSVPGEGHFVMAEAEWLTDDARIELAGVDRIVVRADEVEMIELMALATEPPTGDHNGQSESSDTTTTTTTATAIAGGT